MKTKSIKKRATFYLSGYDPRGAKYYYSLYQKEASKEKNIKVSSKKRIEKHIQSWDIEHKHDEGLSETSYHFLEWDDIIRKHWRRSSFQLIKDLFFYLRIYIFGGLFFKYMIKSYRQIYGIFFPLNYLIVSTLIAYAFSWSIFVLFDLWWLSVFFFIAVSWGLLLWGSHVGLFWLLRIFVFSAKYVLEEMPSLEKRIDDFATHLAKVITEAKENEIDEVLVVAHSVGAILAIPILSRTLQKLNLNAQDLPHISVLTLGECIPLVSVMPSSFSYQKEMKDIAENTTIRWLDYTSTIDLACFPALNFFDDMNIKCKDPKHFHFLSPRFHTLYEAKKYQALKKDRYMTHFMYMMSQDKKEGYNFFTLTSGKNPLEKAVSHA